MGDTSLSDLFARCFGAGYDCGKLGIVSQYIGSTAVRYNKDKEMAEICLGEPEVIIKYHPNLVKADFSKPLSKKRLENRIGRLRNYHMAYENQLRNIELIAAYEIMNEYSSMNEEIRGDITAFASNPEKSLALVLERARLWLDTCIDRKVIASLRGHIQYFISSCESGIGGYALLGGVFGYGKTLMTEQLTGLDGNLGTGCKEALAECIFVAGDIERQYTRLVTCQERLRKEFETMWELVYPETPKP